MLALEELLRVVAAESWSREQVAAAVASLYANTPSDWERVDRYIRNFLGDPSALPSIRGSLEDEIEGQVADVYLELPAQDLRVFECFRRSVRRVVEGLLRLLARMPAGAWTIFLAAGMLLTAFAVLFLIEGGSDLIDDRDPSPPVVEVVIRPEYSRRPVATRKWISVPDEIQDFSDPGRDMAVTVRRIDEDVLEFPELRVDATKGGFSFPQSDMLLVGAFLTSVLFGALGVLWWQVPGIFRRYVEQRRNEAKVLRRKSADARGGMVTPYLVEQFEPFGSSYTAEVLDRVATILGRIESTTCGSSGDGIDIDETVDRTIHAGGVPLPAMKPTQGARELLIFVDVEQGDHPFLQGVEWVLKSWRRGGLAFIRCNFSYRPTSGLELCQGQSLSRSQLVELDSIARRTEGMPLIVFSRGSDLVAEINEFGDVLEARWLDYAGAWPRRVYVDLDPRPVDDTSVSDPLLDKSLTLEKLREKQFVCVPFSLEGIEAAGLHLAGRGGTIPLYGPLRPLSEIQGVIKKWLAAVAVVPDPTWVQMEAYRREFLSEELPDPRYLHRALEWVQERFAEQGVVSNGTKDNGQRLALDRFSDSLIVEQVCRDSQKPECEQLIVQARKLLLRQLEGAAPSAKNTSYKMWLLKVAYQEAMLEPARADELLGDFLGTAVEDELMVMVAGAEAREATLRDSGKLKHPLAAKVRSWRAGGNRLPVDWLHPKYPGARWQEAWLVGLLCGVFAVVVFSWNDGIETSLTGYTPEDAEVSLGSWYSIRDMLAQGGLAPDELDFYRVFSRRTLVAIDEDGSTKIHTGREVLEDGVVNVLMHITTDWGVPEFREANLERTGANVVLIGVDGFTPPKIDLPVYRWFVPQNWFSDWDELILSWLYRGVVELNRDVFPIVQVVDCDKKSYFVEPETAELRSFVLYLQASSSCR